MKFGLLLSFAVLTGCSASASGPEVQSDDIVSQSSPDLTVVKAFALEPINGNGSPGFVESECTPVPLNPAEGKKLDCTKAMEKRYGLPALHDILIPIPQNLFYCYELKVTTVSKKAAIENADGIGFFYRGYYANGRYIPKASLKEVGNVILKNGEPGVLHEFVGLANCFLGDGSSSMQATYDFKPFMRFVTPSETYDNWDLVPTDYRLTTRSSGFDRTSEVLK